MVEETGRGAACYRCGQLLDEGKQNIGKSFDSETERHKSLLTVPGTESHIAVYIAHLSFEEQIYLFLVNQLSQGNTEYFSV